MNINTEDYMCCVFSESDPKAAKERLSFDRVRDYGSECNGHSLHTWDDGERFLARCRHCGKLLLIQDSEYHAMNYMDDSDYRDIYPVKSTAEAEELNRRYSGFGIETELARPALFLSNDKPFWHVPAVKKRR